MGHHHPKHRWPQEALGRQAAGSWPQPSQVWDGPGLGQPAYLSRKVEVSMTMLLETVKVSAVMRTRTGR